MIVSNTVSVEERLTLLEYKDSLKQSKLEEINTKLDDLLSLQNKGIGAFWLASALLGTGIIGAILQFISWLKT